ncbi:MAG: coproporphyrinogen dehydrogenase HemZ [Firmicutes bacterium]|nr:coproporphyrinogen dehydrogenase HemZ [Bacillota bacterium]
MFEIRITGTDKLNPYEELIKVFLQPSEYRLIGADDDAKAGELIPKAGAGADSEAIIPLTYRFDGDSDAVKRQIYRDLEQHTGKSPKWGILTGIRPVKLAYELTYGQRRDASSDETAVDSTAARMRTDEILKERYLLHPAKRHLVQEILEYQRQTAGEPAERSLSVYLGIPFCPTRCLYCSFTSNQVGTPEIRRYLQALHREIEYAGAAAAEDGFRVESVYFGGGTPTTPDPDQLDRLLEAMERHFDLSQIREFTVEAGRPDTITEQKLAVLRAHGVDRISINPQSMHQRTLDRIGRRHTVLQTEEAFALAKAAGFDCINADLIAGLPGEDFPDFAQSLERVTALGADNITLHTLAVKRASRLKEMDENYNYKQEVLREEMLAHAAKRLREEGFAPYYLYRQKHTSGSTENIGYCREDKISVYNIRIMEERQSILALGAGGISKIWFPAENRLERIANVSNYEIYIDRIDEMIARKRAKFFGQTTR